jgi:Alpha/beta hydrolase family
VNLLLHNTQPEVSYELLSKQTLLEAQWISEGMVTGVDNDIVTPATVSIGDRTDSLFLRALLWLDSDGDGIPDWWMLKYFGHLAGEAADHSLASDDYDSDWVSNLQEFQSGTDPNKISFSFLLTDDETYTNTVAGMLMISGGVPSYLAVLVNNTNFADAIWQPYTTNVTVNLNLGNGIYSVWVGLRGLPSDGQQTWIKIQLRLYSVPLALVITNPTTNVIFQPVIQLQGYANESLSSLTFDISNAAGIWTNQTCYITGRFYDTNLLMFTTNYFQCCDIWLANGCNAITLRATDLVGNATTTNFSFTFDYSSNTNPPALTVVWPQDGTHISGGTLTLEAQVDDPTVTATASIVDASGDTNTVQGLVERNGLIWVQNLPVAAGANMLTITASNAAGRASAVNLTLFQSSVTVTLDSLSNDELNQASVNVTGTVSDPSCDVWVNGVEAMVYDDGSWEADNVPMSSARTATFEVEVFSGGANENIRNAVNLPANSGSGKGHTNAANNNTAEGLLLFTKPKPFRVGLISYSGHQHQNESDSGYWNDTTINWFYASGGNMCYRDSGGGWYTGGDPSTGLNQIFNLPAGENAISPPWEYAAQINTSYSYFDGIDWQSGTWENQTETRVMLESQGQVSVDETNLYLIRAKALESTDLIGRMNLYCSYLIYGYVTWWQADLPLPPEWLQIKGQTLINTHETNADGSVWGETIISAPAGKNVDITPTATQVYENWDYTFTNQAFEIHLQLAVDANRDGNITFDTAGQANPDQTTADKPYRFWVNNDHDGYDPSIGDYDDLDPATGTDAQSFSITCTRDLEDYTRLWINTQGITEELQNGTFLLALEWKDAVDDPQMQFFQAAESDGGTLYLTDTNVAQQQFSNYGTRIIEWRHLNTLTKYNPFIFPTNFWSNISADQPAAHLLFDAVSQGSGKLVVSIYKNDGVTKLGESQPTYLKLQDVKEMYERWTVDNGSGSPTTTASLAPGYSYDPTIPAENDYILFVHGWNLAPWERDAFAETAFKRLYWQGYKGHFGAFQWPTQYGFSGNISGILDADNFDNSEFNAWYSATGLLGLLNNLNSQYPGHVYLVAHSMGNVVAGEALKLAGSSQVVNTYVAMQAAVASHAYDPTTYVRTNDLNLYGIGYNSHAPNYYASYYTNGAPCYFDGTAGAANYINFYNQRDYALARWEVDEDFKPDDHAGFSYNSSANKFYLTGTELDFPHDTYVIFPYCATAFCYGLGEQANVGGAFLSLGEPNQLNLDTTFDFGNSHAGHSAEFHSDNMSRAAFWNTLLNQMGLLQ